MNFTQLECFSTLAECLNYTQTADLLHITQPTLSRSIATLEKELGFKLFTRSTRNVALTNAGTRFVGTAKQLITTLHAGIHSASLAEQGYIGSIRIGYLRDTYDVASTDLLLAFTQEHPEVYIELVEFTHSNLLQAYESLSIDAALGTGIDGLLGSEKNNYISLFAISDCAVCSPVHPLAQKKTVHFRDLKDENFVILARTSSAYRHDHILQRAMNAGFLPNIVGQASFIQGIFMLVASNQGISLLPQNLEYMTKGRIVFIPVVDIPKREWAFCWKKDNLSPTLQLFVHTARQMAMDGQFTPWR